MTTKTLPAKQTSNRPTDDQVLANATTYVDRCISQFPDSYRTLTDRERLETIQKVFAAGKKLRDASWDMAEAKR